MQDTSTTTAKAKNGCGPTTRPIAGIVTDIRHRRNLGDADSLARELFSRSSWPGCDGHGDEVLAAAVVEAAE
jgi:hypothetical protein